MRTVVLLLSVLALGACAQTVSTNVSQFHQIERPGGETFQIVPMNDAKPESLEFETYAGFVRQRLLEYGYEPTATNPDIRVELGYSVSAPRTAIDDRGGNFGAFAGFGNFYYPYGGFGPFYPYYGGAFGYPYGFAGGGGIDSYDVYNRHLAVDMIDTDTGEVVYEGRLVSRGRSPNLPEVMPYLVEAMFTDFPGENGETQRVDVEVQKGDKRASMAESGY